MPVNYIAAELVIISETEFALSKIVTSVHRGTKHFHQTLLTTTSRVKSNVGSVLFEKGALCTRTFQENMAFRQQIRQIHVSHPLAHSTRGIC